MITVTPSALKEIELIIKNDTSESNIIKGDYIRVGVKGGGCSGMSYILDITENVKDDDLQFPQENSDLIVICDQKSCPYLVGTIIGFENTIMNRGFIFNNPNATSSCGCNQSFSA